MSSAAATPEPLGLLLAQQPLAILDGALATELERRGADLNDPLWSARCLLDDPGLIRRVHTDYFAAGADIATSATYQASFEGFARRGIDAHGAAQLMREAVQLACQARDEFWSQPRNRLGRMRPLIAASIGPYGAMLADGSEYHGRYAVDDGALADFHARRLTVLATSGADLLACETIPSLREARILAALIEELAAGPAAWISFSCGDEAHTCAGDDVAECAAALDRYRRIAAIGVNCSAPQYFTPLLERMHSRTNKPLIAYPNAGERYDARNKVWTGTPEVRLADRAYDWYRAGARLIGGCCRTSPEDIRALTRRMKERGERAG